MLSITASAESAVPSAPRHRGRVGGRGNRTLLKDTLAFERNGKTRERIHLRECWVAVRYDQVQGLEKEDRRRLRGKWVHVSGPTGSIYRVLRFAGRDFSRGNIGLDWEGWLEIAEPEADSSAIAIRPARLHELPFAMLSHSDPAQRASYLIALLALVLGVLSVVLALAV